MLYLDNAATTPLSKEMKKHIASMVDIFGNPSSKYNLGVEARKILEKSRDAVAGFINANNDEIYFTSSGSASNTMGIKGYISENECEILYSPIAHKSIIKCVESCNVKTQPIPVNAKGEIIIEELERLCLFSKNPLVIIDYVNSEIGVIQNIKKIVDIVHFYNGIVYVDCTASISTIPLDVKECKIDMCGFSGHKIGALKGTGVFYKRKNIRIAPLVYGVQENGLIGGTENVLGIFTLYRAVLEHKYDQSSHVRDYVYDYIMKNIPNAYLIGDKSSRVVHNLYICFKGIDGESLMLLLDLYNIQVSTGSACNSNEITASHVLTEIGIKEEDLFSCIRMTFNGRESIEDLDFLCSKLSLCVEQLRNMK